MGCSACGDKPKKDNSFTKAVVEIENPGEITLIRKVTIPASMGDDTTVPPAVGKYKNVLLFYEANSKSFLYSSDGIPTQLVNGFTNYEDAINLPEINGVTLMGNKSSADLKLADAPLVITVADGNTSWSGADTAEDVYDFFLNKGKVNIVFNGEKNYSYEIASAAYIPEEEKMMCTLAVATIVAGETSEFEGNALFGTMTLYTTNKAIDVSQIELQPKLFIADFTGLDLNYNELSGAPATAASIGMVKPAGGLNIKSDGTLTTEARVFDTVADMKLATNLVAGSYAQTLGFYSLNDGGGATYYITDSGTANEMDVIAVGDLYANLVYISQINIKQLGAYGDDTHDDINYISRGLTLTNNILIPNGTFKTSQKIEVTGATNLECNGSIHFTGLVGIEIVSRYSNINIYRLVGDSTTGSQAVVITNPLSGTTGYNNVKIDRISGCDYGICILPTNGSGILYNEFHFTNIYTKEVAIYFKGDDLTSTYANENNFYGGRVGYGTGVKFEKGTAQTWKFGSNHFYHIGFEGLDEGINIEFATSNIFRDIRMSESLNGNYWIVCSDTTWGNVFDTSSVDITKISDSCDSANGYNTYIGHPLLRAGVNAGKEMRVYKGKKLFDRIWNLSSYIAYVSTYNSATPTITADYFYNGMVIEVGGDNDADYEINLPACFGLYGITDFYLYVKKKTSGSTMKVLNANGSTIVKTAVFPGAIEKQLFHVTIAPHFTNSNSVEWIVTS